MFQHTSINDLLWRRLIKIALVSFYNLPDYSQLWSGKLLKPTKLKIDHDKVAVFETFLLKEEDEEDEELNKFYFKQEEEEMIVYPEESMSGILLGLGRYKEDVELNTAKNTKRLQLLEDISDKRRKQQSNSTDRSQSANIDIERYYERKKKYKHLEDDEENEKDKRKMTDILKEEIRNIRDPKFYGRGGNDDLFPVRDDIPQKEGNTSVNTNSRIIGLAGNIDSSR